MSGTASSPAVFEIPLTPMPQTFYISLSGTQYQLVFNYRNVSMGGWVMDINDPLGNPLVCGIPLVTGANLLGQYGYLDFAGGMMVLSDGDWDAVPTFANLGLVGGSHLYWVSAPQ
jgi:hypothetical protein